MNSTITDRTTHLLELMKKADDAFNSRDVEGMNETYHTDIVSHIMGIPKPIKGRKAHAAMIQQMIGVFPDIQVHNDPYPTQFGGGDWTTIITRATGTFTGEMKLPDGKVVPPTGKAFDLTFSTTARWEGDELIEEYVFVDPALRAKQIGLA
jgi:ketosteroid isomerase-like protein